MIQKTLDDFAGQKIVPTQDAVVQIGISVDKPLKPGPHTFKLVVIDNANIESDAVVQTVTVLADTRKSIARVSLVPIAGLQPGQVPYGQPFTLDASSSTPVPGRAITSYKWIMVS